jgi:hypothetical protein
MPHVHQLNLVFDKKTKPDMLLERLSNTRRVVIVPYEDSGKKHDWTSEILEAFVSGFERPISPEIFELLFSDAIIPSCRRSCSWNRCPCPFQITPRRISCSADFQRNRFTVLWTEHWEWSMECGLINCPEYRS